MVYRYDFVGVFVCLFDQDVAVISVAVKYSHVKSCYGLNVCDAELTIGVITAFSVVFFQKLERAILNSGFFLGYGERKDVLSFL